MKNLPNILTLSRVIFLPLLLFMILSSNFQLNMYSVVLFIAISFTDFLDGFIARNQGSTSDFGKMLDPIADKLLVVGVLISLMITGTIEHLNLIPALLIISREIFISGLREFAANSKLENTIEVSNISKIKTALQMISLTLILLSISFQNSIILLNIGIILLWASMILTLISGFKYCLLYTSPSPRDGLLSRMPSSA